jgi:tetratricopeptide (TPR) repeat protein
MRFSEWSDVTPIAVSSFEPEHPICRIDYPEQCEANLCTGLALHRSTPSGLIQFRAVHIDEAALGYMFAAIEAGELSERALSLVARVIELNPAHYTAWYYRRRCLRALGKSKLVAELNYIEEVAQINPKNYQIWYHRRAVAEEIGNSSQEVWLIHSCYSLRSLPHSDLHIMLAAKVYRSHSLQ